MANYAQTGNRYTAIFVIEKDNSGGKLYKRAPFDLVRFNVDSNPDAEPEIVPLGVQESPPGTAATPPKPDTDKIYEKIWVVETMPYSASRTGKHDFAPHLD